jgi:diadenosine tetraphosphate (Ap4A) HIT family hydrolase
MEPATHVVLETDYWRFALQSRPPLIAGQGFIVLNRHCESVSDLTAAELTSLGPFMSSVDHVLRVTLNPVRVHFGLYGESVPHLHLHVLPRGAGLPAGNIPVIFLTVWYRLLQRVRVRRGVPSHAVEDIARLLRAALQRQGTADGV